MAWLCSCGQQNFLDGLTCLACDKSAPAEEPVAEPTVAEPAAASNRFRFDTPFDDTEVPSTPTPSKRNRFKDDAEEEEAQSDDDADTAVLVAAADVAAPEAAAAETVEPALPIADELTTSATWPDVDRRDQNRRDLGDRRTSPDRRAEWARQAVVGLPEGWPTPFATDAAEQVEQTEQVETEAVPAEAPEQDEVESVVPEEEPIEAPVAEEAPVEPVPQAEELSADEEPATAVHPELPETPGFDFDFEDLRLPDGLPTEIGDDRDGAPQQPVKKEAPSLGALGGANATARNWNMPNLPGGRPAGASRKNVPPMDAFDDEDEFDFDDPATPAPPGEQSVRYVFDDSDLDEPDEFELEDDDWALPEEEPLRPRARPKNARSSRNAKTARPRSAGNKTKKKPKSSSRAGKPGLIDLSALREQKTKIIIIIVVLAAILVLSTMSSTARIGGASPADDQSLRCSNEVAVAGSNRGDLQQAMVSPSGWTPVSDQAAGTGVIDVSRALATEPNQARALANLDGFRFVDGFDRTFTSAGGSSSARVAVYEMSGPACASGYAAVRSTPPVGARAIEVPGAAAFASGPQYTAVTVNGSRLAVVTVTTSVEANKAVADLSFLVEQQAARLV